MTDLAEGRCEACRADAPVLTGAELVKLMEQLPVWRLVHKEGVDQLVRVFPFRDFSQALDYTNRVAELAERQDHHPAITTEWGKVTVVWWTHKINGLHRNDFIMAAKCSELYHSTA